MEIDLSNVSIGKSCVFSVLYNIFYLNNLKISEDELFILCNGLQLTYDREKYLIELDLEKCMENLTYYGVAIHTLHNEKKKYSMREQFNYFLSKGYMALLEISPEVLNYQKLYQNSLSKRHSILAYSFCDKQIEIIDSHMINDENGNLAVYAGKIDFGEIERGLKRAFFIDLSNYKLDGSPVLYNSLWKKNVLLFLEDNPLKQYVEDLNGRLHYEEDFYKLCSKIVFDNKFFSFLYILNYLKGYINSNSMFNEIIQGVEVLEQDINLTNYIFLKAAILKKTELYKKGVKALICNYDMMMNIVSKLYYLLEVNT